MKKIKENFRGVGNKECQKMLRHNDVVISILISDSFIAFSRSNPKHTPGDCKMQKGCHNSRCYSTRWNFSWRF